MKTFTKTGLVLIILFAFTFSLKAQEIFDAIRNEDIAKVKELVGKDKQQVTLKNAYGYTPLYVVARLDNEEIASFLIENGADINIKNDFGYSPLMISGDKVSKLLIEKGADLYTQDKWGSTVLEISVGNNRYGKTKYILEKMVSENKEVKESIYKTSLMHLASGCGAVDIIAKLIKSGYSVRDTNNYRWTPLHFAAKGGHKDAIVLLLENGADINARTIDGYSPYNLAVESGNKDIADYLISKGADKREAIFPYLTGRYFGQKNPGKTVNLFPPGMLFARYRFHTTPIFSNDGTEAYWSALQFGKNNNRTILETKLLNGRWMAPRMASFCIPDKYYDAPFITPDGKKLFFISTQPIDESGKADKENIWVAERTDSTWSKPEPLPPAVNSLEGIHHQFSADENGNLYFGADTEGGYGEADIYFSKFENGEYQKPVNLGNIINGTENETTPFISPDGNCLIFSKYYSSGWSLHISFKKKNGEWTKPAELSKIIKYPWDMYTDCPFITYDNEFMLIKGSKQNISNLYWADASFIEDLRKEALKDDK